MRFNLESNAWGIMCALGLCFVSASQAVDARGSYLDQMLVKYPDIENTQLDSCSTCHTSVPSLNAYGNDWKNNGRNSSAFGRIELPDEDADNDGVPNLDEILHLSMPGSSSSQPDPPAATDIELVTLWDQWDYLDTGEAPDSAWVSSGFDLSAWSVGPAQLGYGNVGEVTTVDYGGNTSQKHITTYFRKVFMTDPSYAYSNLKLYLLQNDGVVVYLNGSELLRYNMPGGAVGNGTTASSSRDSWATTTVDAGLLNDGENILAVETHQSSASGSSIGFNLLLEATAEQRNAVEGWMLFE